MTTKHNASLLKVKGDSVLQLYFYNLANKYITKFNLFLRGKRINITHGPGHAYMGQC